MDADLLARTQATSNTASGQVFSAYVSRLSGADVYVIAPSLTTRYEYGPVKVTGQQSFAEQDECLLFFDQQRTPWIAANGANLSSFATTASVTAVAATVAMQKIGDFTLTAANVLGISSIPQTFKHLRVEWTCNTTRVGSANTGLRFTHNSVTANNWMFNYSGYGFTGAATGTVTSDTRGYLGQVPAGNKSSGGYVSSGVMDIPHYSDADHSKSFMVNSMMDDGNTLHQGLLVANTFRDLNPVTKLEIYDDVGSNFGTIARATLYGIK